MAFKWHCITSSCAEVVYQEYLPAVVRWRYPGEAWQEIEGDSYTTEQEVAKCPVPYQLVTRFQPGVGREWREYIGTSVDYNPPFEDLLFIVDRGNANPYASGFPTLTVFRPSGTTGTRWNNALTFTCTDRNGKRVKKSTLAGNGGASNNTQIMDFVRFQRQDGQPDNCGNCIFTITKDGQKVYAETRNVCPEVEKLPCRKSDEVKIVNVKKLPYLSAVEVADVAYDAIHVKGVPYPLPIVTRIPSECLNIYRQEIYDFLPQGDPDAPDEPVFGDFITQICSTPGCPPPAYGVVCRDDCGNLCQSCPSDTCAVECDGQICCYDESGIAVKTITLSNYCGGQL